MNAWINANAGAAVAPTNRPVTTKIRSILRMAFTSLPLRSSHGSEHEALGASSIRPIFSDTRALLMDSELRRTPSLRSSFCPIAPALLALFVQFALQPLHLLVGLLDRFAGDGAITDVPL